ncbi:Rv1355c family protein [Nocardia acidivorans]|uniref:Rv1355c family protein n=1 Tax=Nocardia acidivorans TaxID=404580 RepID=UPI00082E5441|nr:Rv1355c family protein [Nocardia acidivorans]
MRTRNGGDNSEWRPVHFNAASAKDREALAELRDTVNPRVHDTITGQLRQLGIERGPGPNCDLAEYGVWVWYPWTGDLVHLLPEQDFRAVRTDRNRYRITAEEQRRLAGTRIGVVGLSVGNAAAIALATEGIGGVFKLADFDRIGLTDLNRLRARVADLGVDKTVLTARQLLEIDPFVRIELHSMGIRDLLVDDFLLGGGRLDLLVEECDDLHTKVLLRERARAHGIPVLMGTSDRGMLDVERFDLEPDRPLLHGLLGAVRAKQLRGLSAQDKMPHIMAILGEPSVRAAASLPEVGRTIGGWPQLASAVALGGAIITDTARRLLLGESVPSGRYHVDPGELVTAEHRRIGEPATAATPFTIAPEARAIPALPPHPGTRVYLPDRDTLSEEAVRWIAAMGTLAPSAHNAQPWALRWRRDHARLECRHNPARDLPALDFENCATWVGFGALLENVDLAAAQLGVRADIRPWPDPADDALIATVELRPAAGSSSSDRLATHLTSRVTNRVRQERRELEPAIAEQLTRMAAKAGGRLQLLDTAKELDEIGALIGAADRLTLLNEAMHHETMRGYRWTAEEVRAHRHGLDLATAELTAAERTALALMRDWSVMRCLREIGGGRALEDLSRGAVAAASAVGLLTVPRQSRESYLHGGRIMQRLWLTATREGIALQPMTALPLLFARLERGGGLGLADEERDQLRTLRKRYRALFEAPANRAEVLLFRLAHAAPPSARALRRPLHEVLTFDPPAISGDAS